VWQLVHTKGAEENIRPPVEVQTGDPVGRPTMREVVVEEAAVVVETQLSSGNVQPPGFGFL
jgi:hypothetical protein